MRNIIFKFGKLPTGLDLLNYFVGLTTFHWTAAASVAVSAIQGRKARKAAQGAAATQTQAQMAGIEEQRRQFDIGQEQLKPFMAAEGEALGRRQALMGFGTPEAQAAAFEAQERQARLGQEAAARLAFESPAEKFARDRAEQAIMRQSSATGGLGGSRVLEALQQQAAGFAQQDIGQAQQSLQSQLQGLNIGMGAVNRSGAMGQQFGQQFAQGQANIGQAQAGGILGAARARNQMYGGIAKGIGQMYGGF